MAENTRPPGVDGQHPPKQSRTFTNPMATDRLYNLPALDDLGRLQLISPPPEETLNIRRTSRSTPFTPSLLASTKRKRAVPQILTEQPPLESPPLESPQPQEATPNPKPRKQSKRHPVSNDSPTRPSFPSSPTTTPSRPQRALLVKSPHTLNPEADFIPDLPIDVPRRSVASARVRRTTPIPPYEPPAEVFTPPREVIMTPSISKSSKRKTTTKQNTAKGKKPLQIFVPAPSVKKELPDIDLSAPMPPPSPSDDPLLLSGPVLPPSSTPTRPPRDKERKEVGVITSASLTFTSPPPPAPFVAMSLPPSSSLADEMEDIQHFDWTRHTEPEGSTDLSMMDMDEGDANVPPLPLFNLNLADLPASSDAGGWTDSDDDGDALPGGGVLREDAEEGEGEYTGKWKMLKVRTKLDPPSSATRERMEEWGKPITPFPKRIVKLDLLKEVHGEEEEVEEDIEMPKDGEEATDEEEEWEVRQMSVPLDDEEAQEIRGMSIEFDSQDLETPDNMPGPFDIDASVEQPISEGELSLVEGVMQEEFGGMPQVQDDDTSFDQLSSAKVDPELNEQDIEDEEEREVRQLSVEFDDEDEPNSTNTSRENQGSVDRSGASDPSAASNELPWSSRAAPLEACADVDYEQEDPGVMHKVPQELGPFTVAGEKSPDAVHGDSSDDEGEDDSEDVGVVKITSTDPRAAARAAAILKQHDYDCFTKIVMMERRRQSRSGMDELTKSIRRKTISDAGIIKGKGKEMERRRSMGVIGDRVYIPGSPAMTLPELLIEAEAEMTGTPAKEAGIRDPFKTPLPPVRFGYAGAALSQPVLFDRGGEGVEWTKEDWKQLDACFTDERLEAGRLLDTDGGQEGLAPIDCVRVEDVVRRFMLLMGGDEVVKSFGDAWNRDNLRQRVKALQNKQRSGNIAPPSTPYAPSPGSLAFGVTHRVPSMEVPDFTPLGRRAPPPRQKRSAFPSAVVEDAPFANLAKQHERPTRKLPASLLAPRYSHLLEEAVAVSQLGVKVAETSVASVGQDHDAAIGSAADIPSTLANEENVSMSANSVVRLPTTPATIGKRVKGFLFSYLPTLSKTAPPDSRKEKQRTHKAGLPLPPPEILEKPRGPISTPIRPPLPKSKPPKELVHLNPAPHPPPKPSTIPRGKKPQRLVELQPLSPRSPSKPITVPRPRRSSGGSVKDLVQSFEDLQGQRKVEKVTGRKMELKRVKSNSDWRTGVSNKPGWRP